MSTAASDIPISHVLGHSSIRAADKAPVYFALSSRPEHVESALQAYAEVWLVCLRRPFDSSTGLSELSGAAG